MDNSHTRGVLFANYDFKSSSSSPRLPPKSRQAQGESWTLETPGSAPKNTTTRGGVNPVFGTGQFAYSGMKSSHSQISSANSSPVKAWIPPTSTSSPSPSPNPSPGNPTSWSQYRRGIVDTSNLGYLAFSGATSSTSPLTTDKTPGIPKPDFEKEPRSPSPPPSSSPSPSSSSPSSSSPLSAQHHARLEREKAEIILGEESWVRSGGILRDSEGNRDFARTEKIREEIRLREWEEEVKARWDEYERRWSELQTKERRGDTEISFRDIPWPVYVSGDSKTNRSKVSKPIQPYSVTLSDLTITNISTFLTEGLNVRGCKVSRKERVRSSLLRWHPDKIMGLVERVVENERKDVLDGIGVVIRCLQDMNRQ